MSEKNTEQIDNDGINTEFWDELHSMERDPNYDPNKDIPSWAEGFDPKSFETPDFPITLKPRLNVVYDLVIKDFPLEPVKTSIGDALIMEVYNDRMVNSIFINRSLGFSLEKIRRANQWIQKDLIGKKIFLQKTEGKKDGKKTFYITCKLQDF
jgi:hypothetical protein